MWKYLALTALTFYLIVPGVVVVLPSVGPLSSAMMHSLLFVAVHYGLHKLLRK